MTEINTNITPHEQGFRMPAEWEKQSAVWLQWPGSYPNSRDDDLRYQMMMEKTWLLMTWEIHQQVQVCILARSQAHVDHIESSLQYFGFNMARVSFYITKTVDVWHRDTGPVFVINNQGDVAITDWNFDGWGTYPDWGKAESHIPQTVAELVDMPVFKSPIVSEGGAIEVNGGGSFMATRSSIINNNRNPDMSHADVEQALGDYLGVRNFIWLSGAPAEVCEQELGDGTDYHIDIAARFAGKNTVLYAWTDDQSIPHYPYLKKHLEELKQASDEDGNPLKLIPVYLPEGGVRSIGIRNDQVLGSGSDLTDASYLNYLVTNNLVLIPAFGNVNDGKAQFVLAECFPGRKIVPIPVVSLTAEGGAIHCVTQHQPAAID